ncbi:MAG: glucosylglycerate hydrolase [Streptosporangiaceae bacterium]
MSQPWLAARAAYILRDNSTGVITKAAPALYPHQWSWDAAFNAIGLATVDPPRAQLELDSLLRGQWRNGMVPHIVFDPAAGGYFPGPERWECARYSADAPRDVQTSGICQPPVHAIAAARIVAAEPEPDAWAGRVYPRLLAWHRYLARYRTDAGSGLITLFHGWESGMDNSPRWDLPYGGVRPGPDLPPYTRRDSAHVASAAERPTDAEYDRYLWLIEEAKRAGYDPARLRETGSFQVGDVLFTAIFAAACDDLAGLADRVSEQLGGPDAAELRGYAAAARDAVLAHRGPDGHAVDVDLRTGQRLATETIAGFAPLIAGGLTAADRGHLVETLLGPRWAGYPELRWPLPPSTSPCSAAFRRSGYWRGPVWPVMTWLLAWALRRDGETAAADQLRAATLDQLGGGEFAEYYDPLDGTPLGSMHQSWTAAVTLDWLLAD